MSGMGAIGQMSYTREEPMAARETRRVVGAGTSG